MARRFSHPRFFVASDAHRARRAPMQGALFSLIALYRSSTEFTSLAEKTRKNYARYLRLIENDFGDYAD